MYISTLNFATFLQKNFVTSIDQFVSTRYLYHGMVKENETLCKE